MEFDSLVSYIPALLARHLAARGSGPLAPEAIRCDTAVLSADLSGFTALTERLAERGPGGAEELSGILNGFFERILTVVAAHGGEVATFAGDAIIAFWPSAEGESNRTLARRAAQCGIAIQDALSQSPTVAGERLHVRIGIGAGSLWAGIVGGLSGRWAFLVAGDPVAEAAGAAAAAAPDQTVVTGRAWPLLADYLEGRVLPAGEVHLLHVVDPLAPRPAPPIPVATGIEALLRAFVPRAVVARIDAGQTNWLAEFRLVTAMFVNVGNLDYDAPGVLEHVHTLQRLMQAGVDRYDGSIVQLVADDKGTILVGAWGIPAHTHEDDAARAVQAALDLQVELQRRGCAPAIGVATGRAFCGDRGAAVRREYAMLGDVVNLAARLMQAAGNGLLCDATTARVAGTRIAFEPLPALALKGKSQPVAVARPTAARSRATPAEAELVGRGTERARLGARVASLRERGVGGVLVVEGEPGIGKSSLLRDLEAQARALGVACVTGAAEAVEQSTPYFVWREVFARLFDADQRDRTAVRQDVLARLSDSATLTSWAPVLNAILPLDLPDTDVSAQMTGSSRADAMREVVLHLLRHAAAHKPLVVALDDGHWFDSPSWALTAAVARRAPSLLLVVATRPLPEPTPPEYATLLDAARGERMALEPLPVSDVLNLVRQRLGVTSLPAEVATFIREKAEGNPFFSEQVAFALRDDGHLLIEGDTCRIATHAGDLRNLDVPDTVQGVVTGRIDRLSPGHQLALKVASVIGRVFPYRILSDVYPLDSDRPALAGSLERLRQLALILLEAPEPELAYLFKHVITQEVAYGLLSFAQRRELHAAVATWHEAHHPEDLTPYLQLLAYHWTRADNPPTAIGYLERAAEHTLANYANAEAIRFLKEALELDAAWKGAGESRRATWEWWLGRAHLQLADNPSSRHHLTRSLAMLRRPVPRTRWGLVASTAAQVVRQLAHRLHLWPQAKSEEQRTMLVQAADIHHELSEIAYFGNDLGLLLYTTVHTLNLAEAAGVEGQLARAYATAGVAAGTAGLHPLARFYCRRSSASAERTIDLPARAFSQLACGVYYSGVGDWRRLDHQLVESAELFERLGDRYRWELAVAQRAYMFLHRGEFARARELLDRAYRSASPDGALQVLLLSVAGLVAADLVQTTDPPARIGELEQLLARNAQRSEAILGNGLLALARIRDGDPVAAQRAADAARTLIPRLPPPSFYTLSGVAGVAQVALGLWERARARREEASGLLRRRAQAAGRALRGFALIFPIGRPHYWLWCGHYRLIAGHPRGAVRAWLRCTTHAERLGMPYETGMAYLALARSSAAGGPIVARYADRAVAILDQLGVAYERPNQRNFETGV